MSHWPCGPADAPRPGHERSFTTSSAGVRTEAQSSAIRPRRFIGRARLRPCGAERRRRRRKAAGRSCRGADPNRKRCAVAQARLLLHALRHRGPRTGFARSLAVAVAGSVRSAQPAWSWPATCGAATSSRAYPEPSSLCRRRLSCCKTSPPLATATAPLMLLHSLDPANLYGSGAPFDIPCSTAAPGRCCGGRATGWSCGRAGRCC